MKVLQLSLLSILLFTLSCKHHVKNQTNVELKNKLEFILERDQGIRAIIENDMSNEKKKEWLSKMNLSLKDIEGSNRFNLMRKFDSINLKEIEGIIEKYGYPSKKLVGKANRAIFYVIQHSGKIDQYLPLIKNASEKGELKKTAVAMMEDRSLMEKGKPQVYGTQIHGRENKSGEYVYIVWPIKNADSVNIRRKSIGFNETIEEYAKEFDIEYKSYKIEEIDKIWE